MIHILDTSRKQNATYWAQNGVKNQFGREGFLEPIQIKVRWEDKTETLRTPQAEVMSFNGRVFVDRDMREGDFLKLGDMESNTVADPHNDPNARVIQKFDSTPELRNRQSLRLAYI